MGHHDQPGEWGKSAFDHPLVKPGGGSISLNGELVLLPKDCQCPKCVERLLRYKAASPPKS